MIVNATPLGMNGKNENLSILSADEISGVKLVYDLVTREDTPLIREARSAGAETIGGLEMLLAQGARQFEIWTNTPAPRDIMRSAALNRSEELQR